MEIQRRCRSYYWKCVQVLHGGKEVWNETVTESCMWQDCGTLSVLADLPLRKLWKRRRRYRTSSNNQSNHRHLRRKGHWMTLTRVLYGEPSPACTPWIRFCQPLITSEHNSNNRVLVTLAARRFPLKFANTRCGVNQKLLMERHDVVLSRFRYLRWERRVTQSFIRMKLSFIPATLSRIAGKIVLLD